MSNQPGRGEIWWVDWSAGRGSEQKGRRPALIIQTDAANLNPLYPNTIVIAVSSKSKPVPFHVEIHPSKENGLEVTSYVKCEQILTISKKRLVNRAGTIEKRYLEKVEKAVGMVIGK